MPNTLNRIIKVAENSAAKMMSRKALALLERNRRPQLRDRRRRRGFGRFGRALHNAAHLHAVDGKHFEQQRIFEPARLPIGLLVIEVSEALAFVGAGRRRHDVAQQPWQTVKRRAGKVGRDRMLELIVAGREQKFCRRGRPHPTLPPMRVREREGDRDHRHAEVDRRLHHVAGAGAAVGPGAVPNRDEQIDVGEHDVVGALIDARALVVPARQDEHRLRRANDRLEQVAPRRRGKVLFVFLGRERQDARDFGANLARRLRGQERAALGSRADNPQDRLRAGKERPLGRDDFSKSLVDLGQHLRERGGDRRLVFRCDSAVADDADRQHRGGTKIDSGRHAPRPPLTAPRWTRSWTP
jgi:hypothetical protein